VSDEAAPPNDAIFEALWKRALETWDDDKAHAALLDHALRAEMLPDLAGRYRALKDDKEKGARAQKKLDAIVVAATQMLFANKSPPVKKKTPWYLTALAFIVCAAMLLWLASMMLRGRPH
jgi:hypothetical protein